jgi:ABC-type multidrug transport system permease subunit
MIGLTACQNFGLADFYLDAITDNMQSQQAHQQVETLVANWKFRQIEDFKKEKAQASKTLEETNSKTHKLWKALPVILPRNFKNLRRQSDIFVTRIANPPFVGLLFFLFFGRFSYGPSSAQSRLGFIQETSAFPFIGVLSCVAIYPAELASFFHDYRSSGARYSALSFLSAYTLQEVPMQLIGSFLFSIIAIYGMNMQGSAKDFFEFMLGVWAIINFGESIGIIFATWIQDALSVSLISTALSVAAQTSGIFSVTLPKWLAYIGFAFPFKLSARIAAINEYSGLQFDCSDSDVANGLCLAKTGDAFLHVIGIKDRSTSKWMVTMLCLVLIYRLIGWAVGSNDSPAKASIHKSISR